MDALRACLPEDLLKVEAEKEQGAESKKRKRQQWDNNGREAAVSADRNSIPGTAAPNTESIILTFPHPGVGNWRQQEPNRCAHKHTMGQEKRLEGWHRADDCMRRN